MKAQCSHCHKWYQYYGNPSNELFCSAKCLENYKDAKKAIRYEIQATSPHDTPVRFEKENEQFWFYLQDWKQRDGSTIVIGFRVNKRSLESETRMGSKTSWYHDQVLFDTSKIGKN